MVLDKEEGEMLGSELGSRLGVEEGALLGVELVEYDGVLLGKEDGNGKLDDMSTSHRYVVSYKSFCHRVRFVLRFL